MNRDKSVIGMLRTTVSLFFFRGGVSAQSPLAEWAKCKVHSCQLTLTIWTHEPKTDYPLAHDRFIHTVSGMPSCGILSMQKWCSTKKGDGREREGQFIGTVNNQTNKDSVWEFWSLDNTLWGHWVLVRSILSISVNTNNLPTINSTLLSNVYMPCFGNMFFKSLSGSELYSSSAKIKRS